MKTMLSPFCICVHILIIPPLILSTSPVYKRLYSARRALPDCEKNRTNFWEEPKCVPTGVSRLQSCNETVQACVQVKKMVQLYSRTSKRFVQILKAEVNARGEKDSPYAKLVLESVNFGRIMIRGEKTKRYLCINKKGKLVSRARKQQFAAMKQCQFSQDSSNGYYQYKSVKYPQWFVGFSRKGTPRTQHSKHRYRQFIRYDTSDKKRRNQRKDPNRRKKKL